MDSKGKVALVTGGGSGIGWAACEIFSERGGAVMVANLREATAKATVESIAKKGGRAEVIRPDVTRWTDVRAAVDTARRVYGQSDDVINRAGILRGSRLEDTSEEEWNEVLRINLTGPFLVGKAAMRAMRQQGRGSIVLIASRMAIRVREEHGAYAASKAGILRLTQMAALEGAPYGIRVVSVCPGFIDTPMTRLSGPKENVDEQFVGWGKVCPLSRAGRPEEVARAMLFVASDEASFITGMAVPVDPMNVQRTRLRSVRSAWSVPFDRWRTPASLEGASH